MGSRTSASADQTETVKEDLLEINTMNGDVRVVRRDKLTSEEVLIEDVLRPIFLAEPLPLKKSRQHLICLYYRIFAVKKGIYSNPEVIPKFNVNSRNSPSFSKKPGIFSYS